jgi:hypothetical protein
MNDIFKSDGKLDFETARIIEELRIGKAKAEEALRAAPRPTAADFDLVAYLDWYFQVRQAALTQEQK